MSKPPKRPEHPKVSGWTLYPSDQFWRGPTFDVWLDLEEGTPALVLGDPDNRRQEIPIPLGIIDDLRAGSPQSAPASVEEEARRAYRAHSEATVAQSRTAAALQTARVNLAWEHAKRYRQESYTPEGWTCQEVDLAEGLCPEDTSLTAKFVREEGRLKGTIGLFRPGEPFEYAVHWSIEAPRGQTRQTDYLWTGIWKDPSSVAGTAPSFAAAVEAVETMLDQIRQIEGSTRTPTGAPR